MLFHREQLLERFLVTRFLICNRSLASFSHSEHHFFSLLHIYISERKQNTSSRARSYRQHRFSFITHISRSAVNAVPWRCSPYLHFKLFYSVPYSATNCATSSVVQLPRSVLKIIQPCIHSFFVKYSLMMMMYQYVRGPSGNDFQGSQFVAW